jgi:hypothetical protein
MGVRLGPELALKHEDRGVVRASSR